MRFPGKGRLSSGSTADRPGTPIRFPPRVAEVLAIHADQIERYGGSKGVRDHGLLEAALYRPQTGHYADLVEEAAALWESL